MGCRYVFPGMIPKIPRKTQNTLNSAADRASDRREDELTLFDRTEALGRLQRSSVG